MQQGKRLLHVPVICLAGLASGCFSTEPPGEATAAPAQSLEAAKCITPQEAARLTDQVLELVNLERSEHDLKPVLLNGALQKIAEDYACRMVNGAFFGHRDPDTGDGPFERAVAGRYTFYAVGENLSAGPTTPAKVMQLWMQSPSHRDIILDPTWDEVGIAVRGGGEYSLYWVQEFGDPADY